MGRINHPLSAPPILADVAAPTVTPQGQDDSETWDYAIVGVTADGERSQVSADGSSSGIGPTVLNDIDLNRITWADVAGYVFYEIWRQVAVAPLDTGLVAIIGPGVQLFDDVGLAIDVADLDNLSPSGANTTGDGRPVDLAQFERVVEAILENVGTATYEIQSSQDKAAWTIEGAELTANGARSIAIDKRWLRIQCTAFTSGTPRAFAAGDAH